MEHGDPGVRHGQKHLIRTATQSARDAEGMVQWGVDRLGQFSSRNRLKIGCLSWLCSLVFQNRPDHAFVDDAPWSGACHGFLVPQRRGCIDIYVFGASRCKCRCNQGGSCGIAVILIADITAQVCFVATYAHPAWPLLVAAHLSKPTLGARSNRA